MEETIDESMKSVMVALMESSKHNLQTEVVCFALKEMKENPSLTISDAINNGFNEWVK